MPMKIAVVAFVLTARPLTCGDRVLLRVVSTAVAVIVAMIFPPAVRRNAFGILAFVGAPSISPVVAVHMPKD